jgi:hypothetical protein
MGKSHENIRLIDFETTAKERAMHGPTVGQFSLSIRLFMLGGLIFVGTEWSRSSVRAQTAATPAAVASPPAPQNCDSIFCLAATPAPTSATNKPAASKTHAAATKSTTVSPTPQLPDKAAGEGTTTDGTTTTNDGKTAAGPTVQPVASTPLPDVEIHFKTKPNATTTGGFSLDTAIVTPKTIDITSNPPKGVTLSTAYAIDAIVTYGTITGTYHISAANKPTFIAAWPVMIDLSQFAKDLMSDVVSLPPSAVPPAGTPVSVNFFVTPVTITQTALPTVDSANKSCVHGTLSIIPKQTIGIVGP